MWIGGNDSVRFRFREVEVGFGRFGRERDACCKGAGWTLVEALMATMP
jgi:hypothetical protein